MTESGEENVQKEVIAEQINGTEEKESSNQNNVEQKNNEAENNEGNVVNNENGTEITEEKNNVTSDRINSADNNVVNNEVTEINENEVVESKRNPEAADVDDVKRVSNEPSDDNKDIAMSQGNQDDENVEKANESNNGNCGNQEDKQDINVVEDVVNRESSNNDVNNKEEIQMKDKIESVEGKENNKDEETNQEGKRVDNVERNIEIEENCDGEQNKGAEESAENKEDQRREATEEENEDRTAVLSPNVQGSNEIEVNIVGSLQADKEISDKPPVGTSDDKHENIVERGVEAPSHGNNTDVKDFAPVTEHSSKERSPDVGKIQTGTEPRTTYSPVEPTSRRSNRSSRFRRTIDPEVPLNQDQLLKFRDHALKGEPIVGLSEMQYNQVMDYLIEERNECAAENQFKALFRLGKAYESVYNSMLERRKVAAQQEALDEHRTQLAHIKEEINKYDVETECLIKDLLEEKKQQRMRLMETHERQLDLHASEWSSARKVRQYNRASHNLIMWRKQFKLLVAQCRFSEADQVQHLINRAEKSEQADAHRLMQRDFENSLKKLEEKQKGERELYEQQASLQYQQLTRKRDRLRIALLNKLKKIEQNGEKIKDREKVWSSRLRTSENCARSANPNFLIGKINVDTSDTLEDATISLPPLCIKRKQK